MRPGEDEAAKPSALVRAICRVSHSPDKRDHANVKIAEIYADRVSGRYIATRLRIESFKLA
jgi:hypothetical protein